MLKRLISSERLERGIWSSASDEGKAKIVCCGFPCFSCWAWVIGTFFIQIIELHRVLTEQSSLILEVPCSGGSIKPDALHHVTGCKYQVEFVNQTLSRPHGVPVHTIGSFKWDGRICGSTADKLAEGKLWNGTSLSFIGNASDGVLKGWYHKETAGRGVATRICDLKEGEVSAPIMIQQKRIESTWAFMILGFISLMCLSWSACCIFFPDDSEAVSPIGDGKVMYRAFLLGTVAAIMSCIGSLFGYMWGNVGYAVGVVVIALMLIAGFDDGFLPRLQQCCEKRRSDEQNQAEEDEQQPLLPSSAAPTPTATPAATFQPFSGLPERVSDEPPTAEAPPDAGARNDPELERDSAVSGSEVFGKQEKEQVLAGICLGLTAGILGGILFTIVMAFIVEDSPSGATSLHSNLPPASWLALNPGRHIRALPMGSSLLDFLLEQGE